MTTRSTSASLALDTGTAVKPLVVILAAAEGTEAPDLLIPFAILAGSGAVDVKLVSRTAEPVRLKAGMAWVEPQMTLAQLARERPRGPEVVIVPALHVVDDPVRSEWLREQVRLGSRVMSICDGAQVLAAAGLLEGRHAAVHWYSRGRLARKYPGVAWRRDLRWVTDGPIITTAGISAAEPAALDLLRQLSGEAAMTEMVRRLGVRTPDQRHSGHDFRLTARGASLVMANRLAVWRHENVAVPISPGFDEFAFGAALDGWSRTFRSTAWAVGARSTTSRCGLVFHPARRLPRCFCREVALPDHNAMETMFDQIRATYGAATARFVALQFEHPYGAAGVSV